LEIIEFRMESPFCCNHLCSTSNATFGVELFGVTIKSWIKVHRVHVSSLGLSFASSRSPRIGILKREFGQSDHVTFSSLVSLPPLLRPFFFTMKVSDRNQMRFGKNLILDLSLPLWSLLFRLILVFFTFLRLFILYSFLLPIEKVDEIFS
jgi:hypothetical protein